MIARIAALALVAAGALTAGCQHSDYASSPDLGTRHSHSPSSANAVYGAQTGLVAGSACHTTDGKADPRCTPGVINPGVTQANIRTTICVSGWTATIRPPASYTNSLKTRQMREYGLTGGPASVEEDHFIPLEVGGNPTSEQNLWPQPRTGAHPASEKDQEENALRRAVCSGSMTLAAAQAKIRTDWLVRTVG